MSYARTVVRVKHTGERTEVMRYELSSCTEMRTTNVFVVSAVALEAHYQRVCSKRFSARGAL